jgi:hypothetical protein
MSSGLPLPPIPTLPSLPADIDPSIGPDALTELAGRKYPNIVRFGMLFVAINGSLQAMEQKLDVRVSTERTRVYMRSAVPDSGLEFDPERQYGQEEHEVCVLCPGGETIRRRMRLAHFALGHDVGKIAVARYIFEAPAQSLKSRVRGWASRRGVSIDDAAVAVREIQRQHPGIADNAIMSLLESIHGQSRVS